MLVYVWEQRVPGDFLLESKIVGHKGNEAKKLTVQLWGKGVKEKENKLTGSSNTQYYIRKTGQLIYGKLDFLHAAFGLIPKSLNNYESTIDSPAFDVTNANKYFLLNLFLRREFYLYYGERANGSRKARRIHEKDFLKMPIKTPTLQEQNKISYCLKVITNLIVLQQRKLDLISNVKEAIINKIFNDNSKKGWHKINLGQIFGTVTDYVSNGSFKSLRENVTSYSEPNYAYLIRLQDASNNWKGPWLFVDKKSYNFLKKSKLFPNDIIMANVGSVGKIFQVPTLNKPMTLAPNAILLRTKSANTTFMFELLASKYGQKKILQKTTPGVQNKINKTDFKKIIVNIPDLGIQNKLGKLFLRYNCEIENQKEIIFQLKRIKKFLLQNMFI